MGEILERYQDLYTSNVSLYVEEELVVHFDELIRFVKKTEESLALGGTSVAEAAVDESEARKVVSNFKARWQDSIQQLKKQAQSDFSGASKAIAKEVLDAILTQLLLY